MRRHNIDFSLPDPGLTMKGKLQCNDLATFLQRTYPLAKDTSLIVTSPLKRTLETTDLALGWLIEQGVPVVLKAEWQETTDKPCDTGTPIHEAKSQWPQFDFSTIDRLYPTKKGPYAYTQDALVARIGNCLKWLQHRPEKVICVVSHSGFMRRLSGRKFGNADFRVFEFTTDNEFVEKAGEGVGGGEKGGRGLSPCSPSRAKEHWAGIKKSSSSSNLAGLALQKGVGVVKGEGHLEIPQVPLRPCSR